MENIKRDAAHDERVFFETLNNSDMLSIAYLCFSSFRRKLFQSRPLALAFRYGKRLLLCRGYKNLSRYLKLIAENDSILSSAPLWRYIKRKAFLIAPDYFFFVSLGEDPCLSKLCVALRTCNEILRYVLSNIIGFNLFLRGQKTNVKEK